MIRSLSLINGYSQALKPIVQRSIPRFISMKANATAELTARKYATALTIKDIDRENNQNRNKSSYGFFAYLLLGSILGVSSNQANCDPPKNINFYADTKQWFYPDKISAVSYLTKGKALLDIESGEAVFSFSFKVIMSQPGTRIPCQTDAQISFEGLDKSGHTIWKTGVFDFQSSHLGEREFVFEKSINPEAMSKTVKIKTAFNCDKPKLDYT